MTREEKALIYFKDLRKRKVKDYSSVFDAAPKDSVVYEAVSAEIEIYDTTIKALEQEPKWIPVSERLPEEGGRYLVYTWSHEIEMAQYVDGYWNIKTPISAWMPLPEPYKDEDRQVDVMEIEDLERGIYTVKKVVLTDDNMS